MPLRTALRFILVLMLFGVATARAQQPATSAPPSTGAISKADRERALGILDAISKGIQNLYYDPKMRGLDWDAVLANARAKIAQANSLNEALTQIAIAVSALNDSHTVFEPPARPYRLDFGIEYQLIWNRCFVMHVRPGSDAEAQGLKRGAEILTLNALTPNRQNFFNIEYLTYTLDPKPEMNLTVRYRSGEQQDLKIKAKSTMSPDLAYRPGAGVRYDVIRSSEDEFHRMRPHISHFGDVSIIRFPWFYYPASHFYSTPGVSDQFFDIPDKIRKDKGVVIDLRGNPGGSVDTLKDFVGMFFDHDVKLYDKVERKKTSPEIARGQRHRSFPGKVIVLVDSESASAAEIFARVMQLEKRATVIGDHTSGSVMEATDFYYASSGVDYGAEVTIANLIMTDGKSLEHLGVSPDEILLPKLGDLESGSDPVLAHAAQELGVTLSPEDAGKLFPYEWPKD
ncbi:MAG: S41 family peptidase [Candidatus Sulfotelmatobacter sp.]